MELSNKTLAIFLVAAIVISVGGTIISLNKLNRIGTISTGYATSAGTANVSISTTESIKFAVNNIDFGAGSINTTAGGTNCTMFANGTASGWKNTATCANFAATNPAPFVLENDGNKNLTVQLVSNKNASSFIGGSAVTPEFQYVVMQNESGSCSSAPVPAVWTDVNVTGTGTLICSDLRFLDTADSLQVGVRIVIPYDASGVKLATFTATGTGI